MAVKKVVGKKTVKRNQAAAKKSAKTAVRKSAAKTARIARDIDQEVEKALNECWDAVRTQLAFRGLTLSDGAKQAWRDRYDERFRRALKKNKDMVWSDEYKRKLVLKHISWLVERAGGKITAPNSTTITKQHALDASEETDCCTESRPRKANHKIFDVWCSI